MHSNPQSSTDGHTPEQWTDEWG